MAAAGSHCGRGFTRTGTTLHYGVGSLRKWQGCGTADVRTECSPEATVGGPGVDLAEQST